MDKRHASVRGQLERYLRSPWTVLKDAVLICLAVTGLFALLAPRRFACPATTTTTTTTTTMTRWNDAAASSAAHNDMPAARPGAPAPALAPATAPGTPTSASSAALGQCNCGASVDEARSLGCKYDTLAAAWLPPRCIDQQLTSEFDRSGDGPDGQWRYWYDANLTVPLSVEDLAGRGGDDTFWFYSTPEWHVRHCLFYWRKQWRARFTGVLVEPRYDTDAHINHCGSIFSRRDMFYVMAGVMLNSDVVVD
ncbi:MIZ zinc finger protein [Purpureocillium lavendulum]|uniref:MIZ zinc finger protein n=1 Tax=Purpureocillium lavendulum TaxID=1247861 RepID=A0AB34FWG1_9HYPO|nr:MIZ zinc finger protein [Purpureocillium lavendulum]